MTVRHGVAFYGTPSLRKKPPAYAPILGIYGENDGGIPVDSVLAMGDALTDAGRKRNPRLRGAERRLLQRHAAKLPCRYLGGRMGKDLGLVPFNRLAVC